MIITSLENEKIKNIIKLQRKKYRDLTNTFIVEGIHMVREVYKEGIIKELLLLENEEVPYDIKYTYVSIEIMKKISEMETPPSIIAICEKNNDNEIKGNRILLLDEVQDPGNLGTIIRSAVAFDVSTIILSENTVDLYNSKVLRSTQGMFCHIPIIRMNSTDAINTLKERKYTIFGTNVENGENARKLDKERIEKYCLVMGNEGNGVRKNIQDMCDVNLYIPMNKEVESLNVGVACSILMYELRN